MIHRKIKMRKNFKHRLKKAPYRLEFCPGLLEFLLEGQQLRALVHQRLLRLLQVAVHEVGLQRGGHGVL